MSEAKSRELSKVEGLAFELGATQEDYAKMVCYLQAMLEKNKEINLTSITDFNEALYLHLLDSLHGLSYVYNAPDGILGDLGSGCGVPGVFLAIASGRETHLIDSVSKKMNAVASILDSQGLSNQIYCISARIEELGNTSRGQYQALTCRAMDKLPVILELASPLLAMGGRLITYKGNLDGDEHSRARKACEIVGMQEVAVDRFELEYDGSARTICVYEKNAEPEISLPRRNGVAHKRPLA